MSTCTPERREAARRRSLTQIAEGRPRDPTPKEIAAFCAEFQSRWSTTEERFRSLASPPWTPPEWRTIDYCEG